MHLERIGKHLGAKIHGVDLTKKLSDNLFEEIHGAFLEHMVLIFPEQDLSPQQLLLVGERFGELEPPHPLITPHKDEPRVTMIINDAANPPENEVWHTDVTWKRTPPLGAALHAQVLPQHGGDTMWVSMSAVYEALSCEEQTRFASLKGVHSIAHGFSGGNYDTKTKDGSRVQDALADYPPLEHPMIRTHPETGRQAVFVNESFTTHIAQLETEESETILSRIRSLIADPAFQFRVKWEPKMLGIWDERCTQHQALADYYPEYREMRRVTIVGDEPVYRSTL